ncbi:MAG: FAD-binding protein [Clostridiales Family XIII bacterium]|jgi:succinate dehydrogenase/fumarate reductase flavoprotein subunit|nr:FAD-binding protein [Clostridiales Family XIII bacterium]
MLAELCNFLKRVLTDKALELGAVIVNRVHVRELLTDGGAVTGAVGLGTREPVITVVTAKTTVLATSGRATRLTGSVTAFDKFEWYSAPSAANGSGKVLAARAGAEVVNLEFVALADSYNLHNYSFSVGLPSGSWWPAGRIVDEDGNVVVRRNRDLPLDDPDYKAKYHLLVEDYQRQRATIVPLLKQGKSLYFDLLEATDEERERILWALGHEGKTGVLKHHLEKRNIDLRTARFPLRLGQRRDALGNGIWVKDATTETSVRNLYATGNELPGTGIGGGGEALVIGFATGEQAAARAKETELPKDVSALCVAELKKQVAEIFGSENGDEWQSGERALQVLLESYLGKPYTENALKQLGLLLHRLSADLKLRADNLHQLNRVLEVIDLYRLAELVAVAARERKSSLGLFRRSDEADYPREEEGTFIGVSWKNGAVKASRLSNPTT